jgi:hypothetical protein
MPVGRTPARTGSAGPGSVANPLPDAYEQVISGSSGDRAIMGNSRAGNLRRDTLKAYLPDYRR